MLLSVVNSLVLKPNPSKNEVIVISLTHELKSKKLSGFTVLSLKYIPDKNILKSEHFNPWIEKQITNELDSWEKFAADITHIFYDTLLPKYLEITLSIKKHQKITQKIELLRQQPGYKIPAEVKDFFRQQ